MSNFDWAYLFLGAFSVFAAAFSLTVGSKSSPKTKKILLVLWLVGPPIFFFLEYMWRYDALVAAHDLERVKDLQQRGAQIWAGVAAALAAIYFKGDASGPQAPDTGNG